MCPSFCSEWLGYFHIQTKEFMPIFLMRAPKKLNFFQLARTLILDDLGLLEESKYVFQANLPYYKDILK